MNLLAILRSTGALAAILGSVHAEVLYEWNFEDSPQTYLSSAESSGSIEAAWDGDFDRSAANGSGQFVVGRTPGGIANTYVAVPSSKIDAEEIWAILELSEWNLVGKSASETIRFGVADIADDERPHVLAQINLSRTGPNEVSVFGESFGKSSESMEPLPMFGANQKEPVMLALQILPEENTFSLYYKAGSGPFLFLGKGKTSPEREINYLRLGLSGYFNASDEIFAIERIAFQTHSPVEAAE
tara:strand:+ start:22260 stop:22988 length:729 start_codon:yes stop_codon:yes gene_type:complete